MFDPDDPIELKAGLDLLTALKSSSLKAHRTTVEIDGNFWQTLTVNALDLMLWFAEHPGNQKGNSDSTWNARARIAWDDQVAQLKELGLFKKCYLISPVYLDSLQEVLRDDLQTNMFKAYRRTTAQSAGS